MRIVLATGIYPPEIGGPATYVRAFSAWLPTHGHHATVVTYGDLSAAPDDGWSVRTISRVGGPLVRYARYAWRVFCLARGSDVVFLQGPVSEGFPGAVAARLACRPYVLKVVGDYAWETDQRLGGKESLDEFVKRSHGGRVGIIEMLERWVARHAQSVIVPSRYLKGIVEAWGIPSKNVSVIYNTASPLPSVQDREMLRALFGVADKNVVLTAVRAMPWKGVDFLISLWRDIPADTMLCVAGEGPMLDAWKKRAQENALASRVRFLGRLDRETLAQWYAAADAFVLATGYEGFPHVVLEAVSTGLPCLVSDRGGNPETKELFPDHVRVLPYRDAAAWTAALQHLPARLAPVPLRSFDAVAADTVEILKLCAS
jgi:glycosyltransferase involved in cell wall biosynthesis